MDLTTIPPRWRQGRKKFFIFFEIQYGRLTCYYNKLGVTRDLQEMYSFGIVPGFHTPDWAKGAGHVSDLRGPFLQRRPLQ